VINPEEEMGRRLALRLMQPTIREQLDLGDATLAEVVAPEQFVGKSLKDLDIRNRFDASVVVIHRGKQVIANPGADEVIQSGDVLVLIGSQDSINRLARKV
jgi:trk system potassium uptake protein TrkA